MVNFTNNNLKNIIALSLIFNFLYSNSIYESKFFVSSFPEFKNNLKNICLIDYKTNIYSMIYIIILPIISYVSDWIFKYLYRKLSKYPKLSVFITPIAIVLVNNLIINIYSSMMPLFDPGKFNIIMIIKLYVVNIAIDYFDKSKSRPRFQQCAPQSAGQQAPQRAPVKWFGNRQ